MHRAHKKASNLEAAGTAAYELPIHDGQTVECSQCCGVEI